MVELAYIPTSSVGGFPFPLGFFIYTSVCVYMPLYMQLCKMFTVPSCQYIYIHGITFINHILFHCMHVPGHIRSLLLGAGFPFCSSMNSSVMNVLGEAPLLLIHVHS